MIDWKGYFFCFLTSLAFGDVMGWLGSIVMGSGCDGVAAMLKLAGALGACEGSGSVVRTCSLSLLRF
jgi:hypothetical protein